MREIHFHCGEISLTQMVWAALLYDSYDRNLTQ